MLLLFLTDCEDWRNGNSGSSIFFLAMGPCAGFGGLTVHENLSSSLQYAVFLSLPVCTEAVPASLPGPVWGRRRKKHGLEGILWTKSTPCLFSITCFCNIGNESLKKYVKVRSSEEKPISRSAVQAYQDRAVAFNEAITLEINGIPIIFLFPNSSGSCCAEAG